MRTAAAVASLLLTLSACGGDDEAERWPGPPREQPNGALDVAGFAAHTESAEEPWTTTPLLAAAEFLRLDRTTAPTTSVVASAGPEGMDPTTVTVTLDRLLDDSVRSKRYELVFIRSGGKARLQRARWAQRCWPQRGHQEFSTELCV